MISEVYDIECLKNCFTYTGYDRNDKLVHQFVIHQSRNDYMKLIKHLIRPGLVMIGYNNLNYDYPILHHLLNHFQEYKNLDGLSLSQKIHKKSDELIDQEFTAIAEWNTFIKQIDLMKIWHFDNKNRRVSLKDLEFAFNYPNVEDMPFDHTHWVEENEIPKILSYNLNDVMATNMFLDITKGVTNNKLYKGKDKIKLRLDIQKEFAISCINYSDVKIGDEINKINYLNNSGRDAKELKFISKIIPSFTFGDCIPSYVKFKTKELNDFLNKIRKEKVDLEKGDKDDKQVYPLVFRGTKYTIAKGGIHSCEKGRKIIPKTNEILRDADVGSQYPNAIRKRKLYPRYLGEEWLIGYEGNIIRRLDSKKKYKETKDPKFNSFQETYKLALNGGGFGKTNEKSSWQYDPFAHFSCTIGNQFEILMLIEDLELNNIHVVSANTDGLVCLFDKSLDNKYYEICHNWEKIAGNEDLGQLEYADYKLLVQTSVNDYVAQKIDGTIKQKGDFEVDKDLHKNPSMRIVPIALTEYFINGTPIEKTIKEHTNIYDFCLRLKVDRSWQAQLHYVGYEDGQPKHAVDNLSRTTRYYISNKGGSLYKKSKHDTRINGVNVGYLATVFNKYIEKDMNNYDINHRFYINECNKIIRQIEDDQLKLW